MTDLTTEALAGPWQAVLAVAGTVITHTEIGDIRHEEISVMILRGTSLPYVYDRDPCDPNWIRVPDLFKRADRPIEWNHFESDDEVRTAWVQAQAMAAGLNNAAKEATA